MSVIAGCHTEYEIKYHFVFVVKYRKGIFFDKPIADFFKKTIKQIANRYWIDIDLIGTDGNHVHMFIVASPRMSPARIAQILKSITARELFKIFPRIKQDLWGGQFWGEGYYVGTIGGDKTEAVIKRYIENQGRATEHEKQLKLF